MFQNLGWPTGMVFFGALLSAVGAFWIALQRASPDQSLKGPTIIIFLGAVMSAAGALWSSTQRADFERQLRVKSEEIADLNKTVLKTYTGGDSFPMVALSIIGPNRALISLSNNGKEYPLYDIGVRVVDLDVFESFKGKFTFDQLASSELHLDARELRQNAAMTLTSIPIEKESLRWNIFFNARNGWFSQLLRMKKINGEWYRASQISGHGKEVLFEQVDDGYPKDKDGKVDWK